MTVLMIKPVATIIASLHVSLVILCAVEVQNAERYLIEPNVSVRKVLKATHVWHVFLRSAITMKIALITKPVTD